MSKNSKIQLAIIIPLYNRFTHIYDLLQSLNFQKFTDFQVVVVDHGTEDFRVDYNNYKFNISIIKASSNLWFTGATNTGIRYVLNSEPQVNFIMIMNDDIHVKNENFLQTFVNESKDDAIISCMAINSETKKIVYAGLKLRRFQCFYDTSYKGLNLEQIEDKIYCDVLPTRATLVPIAVIKKIGFLNEEKLPQYGSDYEWTSRAKKQQIDLIMLTSTYIKTQISSNRVSGRNLYSAKNKFKCFLNDLFDRHQSGNVYDITNYSFLVFNWPYAFFFVSFGLLKKILGFVIVNYFNYNPKHFSS
ncbi:glycosyltransferase family 2 protein [Oscillatoria sp. HE19RPO]|uniref:glycosyltransferase family 2 protein n=1 Tax=Oscillatoria sp. HE19RPO TaxID=2954806 RepID=UPI0020C3DC5A|nr:glycosyltransferase [Oscillatoria sp. HE19RPO]